MKQAATTVNGLTSSRRIALQQMLATPSTLPITALFHARTATGTSYNRAPFAVRRRAIALWTLCVTACTRHAPPTPPCPTALPVRTRQTIQRPMVHAQTAYAAAPAKVSARIKCKLAVAQFPALSALPPVRISSLVVSFSMAAVTHSSTGSRAIGFQLLNAPCWRQERPARSMAKPRACATDPHMVAIHAQREAARTLQ